MNNLKLKLQDQLGEGLSIKFEAHHLPMNPRKVLSFDRATLVGDAAGLVQQTSGEGIYWAMKSGEMAARAISKNMDAPTAANLRRDYDKPWWKAYKVTYTFLEFLQRISYNSRFAARDLCADVRRPRCAAIDLRRLFDEGHHTCAVERANAHDEELDQHSGKRVGAVAEKRRGDG